VELYSAINKNGIVSLAGKYMRREMIMESEIRHTQKYKYFMFFLISGI
jgi:hypothetical protein